MELNDTTASKIIGLFNMPIETVEYNGASNGLICFCIGKKDSLKNWVYGFTVYLNENFKVKRLQRMRLIQSTGQKNRPTEIINLPIYKL